MSKNLAGSLGAFRLRALEALAIPLQLIPLLCNNKHLYTLVAGVSFGVTFAGLEPFGLLYSVWCFHLPLL